MEVISFYARDGYPLKGQVYKPSREMKGGVLITAGTGYKARYYRRFAEELASAGLLALTFDCRGIGESAPDDLAALSMRYWDWGKLDMPAALDNLAAHAEGKPLLHIGHSVGGHFVGFWDNHDLVKAHGFVCVGSGSLKDRQISRNPMELLFWNIIGPRSIKKHGYVKKGPMWTGASLPRAVFEDWKTWCHTDGYFCGDLAGPLRPHYFEKVTAPITSFLYTDDPVATPRSSPAVLNAYLHADKEYRLASPKDFGLKSIGHGGPFGDQHKPARDSLIEWAKSQVG